MNYRRVAKSDKQAIAWTKVCLKNGDAALVLLPLPVRVGKLDELKVLNGCPLSIRELQVVSCVASGMTNPQIGEALGLSTLTIKSHLARISRKVRTGDRAGIVSVVMRMGWLE